MQRLGLPAEAQDIVATIRTSPPSRAVTGRAGNVCARYPSRKMGVTIQAESHRVELAAIYLMEHDPDVLEYYDQRTIITLDGVLFVDHRGHRCPDQTCPTSMGVTAKGSQGVTRIPSPTEAA
jgi:hypothetical protein